MHRITRARSEKIECLSNHPINSSSNVRRDVPIQRNFCGAIACAIATWKFLPRLYT
jgi:hypothetical protein